ncbi:MAG: hypothetical protein ABL891_15570 [Burkholderiales bacterium]
MAVNEDNQERDPHLVRLVQAASGEEPPAALDAAILAAARREVGARPQVVSVAGGGGGEMPTPVVRAKRNWYVPVSIAAVMVLSVSLVLTMHHEKGDELSQPPKTASAPPRSSAPAPAAEAPAAASEKSDTTLRDAVSAKAKVAEEKRAEPPKAADAAPAPEAYAELAKKQRQEKAEAAVDSVVVLGGSGSARKDQADGTLMREQGPASGMGALKSAPARERRPDPFPAASEREAPAAAPSSAPVTPAPTPVQPSRDAAETRNRSDADRNTTRGVMQEAPVVAAAPSAPPAPASSAKASAAPGRAAPVEDSVTSSAPAQVEGRVMATPPPPPARMMTRPAAAPAKSAIAQQRLPLWRGLEDQPPEKWLERLAEFKRDNRQADADELLAEFRRRFPDHPASVR